MSANATGEPQAGRILIGPHGWSYADWAGIVYPAHKPAGFHEAAYLSEFFDTIEINTSFYQPLRPEHCRHWIDSFPPILASFSPQSCGRNSRTSRARARKMRRPSAPDSMCCAARNSWAPFCFSFRFRFTRTEKISRISSKLLNISDYPLVVEVRHASWNDLRLFTLSCTSAHVGFCNIDQPVIGRSMKPTERATAPRRLRPPARPPL